MTIKKTNLKKNQKNRTRRNALLDSLDDDALVSADTVLQLIGAEPLTLGRLIRTMRRLGEKTQAEVAQAMGVSVGFLSAVELGTKSLSPRHARALSKVISYSEEVILEKILEATLAEAEGNFEVIVRRSVS